MPSNRARNYRAEYAARMARARREGFGSYWEVRQFRAVVGSRARDTPQLDELTEHYRGWVAGGQSPAQFRRLVQQGRDALRRRDHAEAYRIARQLGYEDEESDYYSEGWAQRAFYYHGRV